MAALGPFEARPALAVAVSGGADSMALALLAHDWAAARGGEVRGLVVDHGLRPGSAAEARLAAARLASHGIVPHVLTWAGTKPSSAVQAKARAARYALLEAYCRDAAILHLLLGHHRGDQAETVAMRAARGSGDDGLAGMAAIREVRGLRLLRPFLAVPGARLRATLEQLGQPWIEDPSNLDRRFMRARLRAEPAFDPDHFVALAEAAAARRGERERSIGHFLACAAHPHPAGFVRIERPALAALDEAAAIQVLERVVRSVGGSAFPSRAASLVRLRTYLANGGPVCTVGGCIQVCKGATIVIFREPGRIIDRQVVQPGQTVWWDSRFELRYLVGETPLTVCAAGSERLAQPPN